MFKGISWFMFFTYLGACLLVYYIFILIYYYRKELSNFGRRGFSKDDQADYTPGRAAVYQSGPLGGSADYSYSFQDDVMDDRLMAAPSADAYERIEAEENQSDNSLSNPEEMTQQLSEEKNLEEVDGHMIDIQEAEAEQEDLHIFNEEKARPVKKTRSSKTDIKSRHDGLFEDVNVNELINITE